MSKVLHSLTKHCGRRHLPGILSATLSLFPLSSLQLSLQDCLTKHLPVLSVTKSYPPYSYQQIMGGGGECNVAIGGALCVNDSEESHGWRISPAATPTVSTNLYFCLQENSLSRNSFLMEHWNKLQPLRDINFL